MNNIELQKLKEYFIGKVATIVCKSVNLNFNEKQNMDYFVGRIDHICELGIWTTHPTTLNKNFYFKENVVAICEEQVVYKDNPNYDNIINAYEQHMEKKGMKFAKKELTERKEEKIQNNKEFVDIESLTNLADQFKGKN